MRVVIVEDHIELSALISDNLDKAGIKAEAVTTGEFALDLIDSAMHDLVILDRGLPDMDGLEVLKSLRAEGIKIPVLILTAKDELGDKVSGLNSGADDYLVKPFEMDELVARIHALYRRPADTVGVVLSIGNIEYFPSENIVKVGGVDTNLSNKEKEALERLLRLPGRVVGKDVLQNALYGYGEEGSQNSVEVVIHRLRKKLDQANANAEVCTLRGIGYLMKHKA